eukprot:TRINITY_DN1829_c0_g1_i1.p1 TRINITY_DN1829_c0_g1~~TRINITY_DN1829_c0_g1_i1.p1  ORF type:complete len:432 (-),score=153.35 TRINITY_DN1829_c0_g1_i1:46-1296(-)
MTSKSTYDENEERKRFAEYLNMRLAESESTSMYFINPDSEDGLVNAVADGVILNKFINLIFPGKIKESKIVMKENKSLFEKTANNELTVSAAKSLGCTLVNIGPDDLANANSTLVLGLLWQLIKKSLLVSVEATSNTLISRLKEELSGEEANSSTDWTPEQALIQWANYHLKKAGSSRVLTTFGPDTDDSEIYGVILNRIAPQFFTEENLKFMMKDQSKFLRASQIVEAATKAFAGKYSVFVSANDIVKGTSRLNFAFGVTLFNFHPFLESRKEMDERDGTDIGTPRGDRDASDSKPSAGNGKSKLGMVWVTGPENFSLKTSGQVSWFGKMGKMELQVKEKGEGNSTTMISREEIQVIPCSLWDFGFLVNAKSNAKIGNTSLADKTVCFLELEDEIKEADLKSFLESCRRFPKRET